MRFFEILCVRDIYVFREYLCENEKCSKPLLPVHMGLRWSLF